MSYESMTIKKLVTKIQNKEIVLPALQRDYVWDENKIVMLFDSLMKNYPIGPLLFWQVEGDDLSTYSFHEFIVDVDLLDKEFRGVNYQPQNNATLAVLDGQQRITSIFVGLTGSYRSKVKVIRKINNDHPKRYLALNLLHPVLNTKDEQYDFQFLSDAELKNNDDSHFWYKVSNILDLKAKKNEIYQYVFDLNISSDAKKVNHGINILTKLYDVVYTDMSISYYEAVDKDLAEAVNIFTRVNNTGKTLTGTDLMLSMASAGNREDMHNKIADAIKQITNATNDETGFIPDRDFILTAMLMATKAPKISTTNADNYMPAAINNILQEWEKVIDAITSAAIYIEELGFNGKKLGKSFLHPIAYYFYKRGDLNPRNHYQSTTPKAQGDRTKITQWLLRAQINNIFAYGTPATLQDIRRIMDSAMIGTEKDEFPYSALMANSQKSLKVSNDDISDILNWKYGDAKILPLFTVIFNETLGSFDVDHLWPQSKMSTESKIKKAAGNTKLQPEQVSFYKECYNLISNLQLLRKTPNQEKNADYFSEWLKKAYPDTNQRAIYCNNACIPTGICYDYANFEEFYKKRRELLTKRLKEYFDVADE